MQLKPANWCALHNREDRLIARIAGIARRDTINGGASALVLANKLKRRGGTDLKGIVAEVYSASTGNHHTQHEAWECPECGFAHLGWLLASACCDGTGAD